MNTPQLFLLHFAGGNCYSFRFMYQFLQGFEVIPLELPGRGKRLNEPLLNDFDKAAEDLYRQIINRLTAGRFVIYGHSMGASLALRVTSLLEKKGKFPEGIVVSGNAGPGVKEETMRYLLDKKAFMEEVNRLGGLPREVLASEELLDFFEPILRADFEVVERNSLEEEPAIQSPLFAVMGSQEDDVEEINNWSRFTKGRFNAEVLKGDHFFIHQHPARVAGIIHTCLYKPTYVTPSL